MDDAERTAADRLRSNEKLKVSAGVMANLGTGLLAAGFGRWFLTGADGWTVLADRLRPDGYSRSDPIDVVPGSGGCRWMR